MLVSSLSSALLLSLPPSLSSSCACLSVVHIGGYPEAARALHCLCPVAVVARGVPGGGYFRRR